MKLTAYSEENLETWPTLFISFYAMVKIFIGQGSKFLFYYLRNYNYFELVDGYITLHGIAYNSEFRSKIGCLSILKVFCYMFMIKRMLKRLKIDVDIPSVGYPFVQGETYEVGYRTETYNGGREYLTYEVFIFNEPEKHPYNKINAERIVSVKKWGK